MYNITQKIIYVIHEESMICTMKILEWFVSLVEIEILHGYK